MGLLGGAARGLLLDVEGTTTPVGFVYETLFPYARAHLTGFLERHSEDESVLADVARVQEERVADVRAGLEPPPWHEDAWLGSAASYAHWLMDRDRKSNGLKSLQGRIWEEGYASGELRGALYEDVPRAFERWRRQGKEIAIFSSGSVLAQKLLFHRSAYGDLTGYIRAYFDTATGAKREAESYRRIAATLGQLQPDVLFISDVLEELDAAGRAGLRTALCARTDAADPASIHPIVRTFDAVSP